MNRIALLQFHVTYDKTQNISTARQYITKAREAGARLCVLPECWNSPYATAAFGEYSENLPNVGDSKEGDWGQSAQMLMEMAKSSNMYIVGGSVPEICDGKLYNTCLVVNPDGKIVGKHRKVHLFDIDVPGGIRFIESETLSAGDEATYFEMDENTENRGLGRIGIGIW
jgi:omega-amidase